MNYIDHIKKIYPLTVNDILQTSKKFVSETNKKKPWKCTGLNHGTAILETEEQLCCYMAAYGEMHREKLRCALNKFPFKSIDSSLEIVDWGCGQGIASVALIDALRNNKLDKFLQKVTLIEPSKMALNRAKLNVQQAAGEDVFVEPLNYYLPANESMPSDQSISGIRFEETICIHLFSNILDISSIDLKELSYLVSSSGYKHYFICVGPLNKGNERIDSFARYFQTDTDDIFVDVKNAQYNQLPNGKWFGCVAKGFKMVREEGKPFLVPLSFYPTKQFFGAYRLDCIEAMESEREKYEAYWLQNSGFEVLAPFDLGASIYDNIDPLPAVLSNIITRGLPTKCSPFVEEQLNNILNFSEKKEKYGTIRYETRDKLVVDKNEELLRKIPIGIARIQKVVIEAVLTNRISLNDNEWNVLVKECDVPCAALAFEDLAQMYNQLAVITTEKPESQFPKINLTIVSEKYSETEFHLGNPVYGFANQVDKKRMYDMVIDIAVDQFVDAVNVQFSEFEAKNKCYFNIRSSVNIYSKREIYTTDRITYQPIIQADSKGVYSENEQVVRSLTYYLNLVFRKEGFRPGQLPILNRALQNKSVIGLLPTGGGKSLTYQMAAILQPGITVIIDPLKSLMLDQYDGLLAAGIDCCTYINSELSAKEKELNELMMERSQVIFTFISPERLCIYEFRERLKNMHDLHVYFSYAVIDEVHCVSEWGQDFRFSYLHLGRNLYSYVKAKEGAISLFGLTATASFDVLSDVERELSGNGSFSLESDTIVRYENSNRLELQYKIEKIEVEYKEDQYYDKNNYLKGYPRAVNIGDIWSTNEQKSTFLSQYIQKVPAYLRELQSEESIKNIISRFKERESLEHVDPGTLLVEMPDDFSDNQETYDHAGIVFCPHVNSSGISVKVNSENLNKLCRVGTFAGSSQDGAKQGNESMENMKSFRENKLPLMVATKAFGMGIDKPNVRFTVNMNYSSSLESFVQEAGRAGRDRKMALSVILMSDYGLARVNRKYPSTDYPLGIIKGKWFKIKDLEYILEEFKLQIDKEYINYCDPQSDIVKLKCNTDNRTRDKNGNEVKLRAWSCGECSKRASCQLQKVDQSYRDWQYNKDLKDYLDLNNIRIPKESISYQGADYNTVMYFFDENFKGEIEEKIKMYNLLSQIDLEYFIGDDKKDKPNEHIKTKGFLNAVLDSEPGTEIVSLISYQDGSYTDIAKAIYRMCVIGLIDDFTQDYFKRRFRILSIRKENGAYYKRLKEFLMRYYPEEGAEKEVQKARVRKGENEVHKCLGYLTEFIYDKVAMKRKRAIDDMRHFCLTGIDDTDDWKEINEVLKDEIYYYFNSKYAREKYETDNGEPFSLLDDTERSKKYSFELLYKYMRVVDLDVTGSSGSPKDNIKHLQGAVRLIRRSETEVNPTLCLLSVFCLLSLKIDNNKNVMDKIEEAYIEGYLAFKEREKDLNVFYAGIKQFKAELNKNNRGIASDEDLSFLEKIELVVELKEHQAWVDKFTDKYNKIN